MKTEFSQIEQQQIIDNYKNGMDIEDIIRNNNTNEHFIRVILKENQIDRQYNTFSKELENRVIYYYKQDKLHKDISYNLLVSSTGINKIIDRNKIPRTPYTIRNRHVKRNSNYFDEIDTSNKAYILGMMYADGNNHYTDHTHMITLSLQEDDFEVLEEIRKEIEYDAPLKYEEKALRNPKHKNIYKLIINDEHMSDQLKKLGVIKNKSLIIKFPTFISDELVSHFIRGYFDGDGCIYYDKKRSKASVSLCGTYDFVSHISNILHNLGIKNNIYHPKQCENKNTYILQTIGNKSSYSFLTWMYEDSDIKMKRKYKKYLDFCEIYNKKVA